MFRLGNSVSKKNIAVLISFFVFSTCSTVSQEIPRVDGDMIYFLDGKTQIQIGKYDHHYIFSEQNRLVFVSCQQKANFREYTLNFFNFYGEKVCEPSIVNGEMDFVFSKTRQRVLAGQRAMLTQQNESYLYDLDGNLLNILTHDFYTKQIDITEDEKYFWFAANKIRPLNPGEEPLYPYLKSYVYNNIMIFDVISGNFLEEFSTLESDFSFLMSGTKYTIPVSPPDIPG